LLPDRVYVDVGRHEGANAATARQARRWSATALGQAERLRDALLAAGLPAAAIRDVEDPVGEHRAADWARRLPGAIRFLFGGARP
jgi:hypothetical protein